MKKGKYILWSAFKLLSSFWFEQRLHVCIHLSKWKLSCTFYVIFLNNEISKSSRSKICLFIHNFLHLSQKFQLYLIILYFCRDFNIILYQLYFHLHQYSVLIHHYKNYIYSVWQHVNFLINLNELFSVFYYYSFLVK